LNEAGRKSICASALVTACIEANSEAVPEFAEKTDLSVMCEGPE
jgi:hypothetical protein